MCYDENSVWKTFEGKGKKLKNLTDGHLANLIQFVERGESSLYKTELLPVLKSIVSKRGLKQEFLNRAQIPYKNSRGLWEIYDFDEKEFVELEEVPELNPLTRFFYKLKRRSHGKNR